MTTPLFVSADWLQEHFNDGTLQVLDARMLPPGMEATRDIQKEYLAEHLPGAPFSILKRFPITPALIPTCYPGPKASRWRCANWASTVISI